MYFPIVPPNVYGELATQIIGNGAIKATKILTEHETVKMTRKLYTGKNGKKIIGPGKRIDIALTIGIPNYEEREFIKRAKKAGEPFPIKKILLKWPK